MKTWDITKSNGPTELRLKGTRPPFKWAGGKDRMFARYNHSGFFPNSDVNIFVEINQDQYTCINTKGKNERNKNKLNIIPTLLLFNLYGPSDMGIINKIFLIAHLLPQYFLYR